MAVITRINGIPLFSSKRGALRWAKFNRIKSGYHIHFWEGKKGYMGGSNHSEIAKRRPIKIDPIISARHEANNLLQRTLVQPAQPVRPAQPVQPTRVVQTTTRQTQQPIQPTPRRTTSGGGGGSGY
jgi:hypothetical protein